MYTFTIKMPLTTILNIETFDEPEHWLGHRIIMSDATKNITCKIDNRHICCEKWGVYTNATLSDFVGAEYCSIDISDIQSEKYELMKKIDITITTNRGTITIQLYNEHNSYYPHDVFIESEKGIKLMNL